jgi:predicted dehydrogenase
VAICDVDAEVRGKVAAKLTSKGKCDSYADVRRLLEDKDIDAISTATPNHWHALVSIWAAQAGKDVYVEKPVSHNVWEGRQIVHAARRYNRVIQTGTQSRSSTGIHDAIAWLRAGNLGSIKHVTATCYKRRATIGKLESPLQIPKSIDYDLWCGPAAKVDILRPRLHYDWHWDFNTGNGDLGNQGIHQMDIARWILGQSALSPRVLSVGARVGYDDAGNTPNTQIIFHDYPAAPLIFEVRGLPASADLTEGNKKEVMDQYRGASIGVVAHCQGGYLLVGGAAGSGGIAYDPSGKIIQEFKGVKNHFETFITAVRSRKTETGWGTIEEGHLSSALCHTGNISHQLGAKAPVARIAEQIKAMPEFTDSFNRMLDHLRANKVGLDGSVLTLGAPLKMDPAAERFIDNDQANRLLTRDYRKPFVVPDLSA